MRIKIRLPLPDRATVALLALLVFAAPGSAQAGDLLQDGVGLFSTGEYEASITSLERAKDQTTDKKRLGQIMLYIGLGHQLLGAKQAAKDALAEALAHDPDLSLDPRRFKRELLELLSMTRGSLALLIVISDVGRAEVHIDGKRIGSTPLRTYIPAEKYKLEVKRGEARFSAVLSLSAGQRKKVVAELTATAPQPVSDPAPSRAEGPSFWGRPRLWTWVAAGAAVVSAGVAIGLFASAQSSWDGAASNYAAETNPTKKEELRLELDRLKPSIEGRLLGSNVMWGIAGGLVVASVVLLFLEGAPEAKQRETALRGRLLLVPVLGDSAGLSMQVRF